MRLHRFIVVAIAMLLGLVRAVPAAAAEETKAPASPTIAVFDLKGPVTERQVDDLFEFDAKPLTLRELTRRIRAAGDDANVKALVLLADSTMAGPGQIEEIRQALAEARGKGKDVFVHADSILGTGQYVLFSAATRVSASPTAIVYIPGLHGEQPYLRGLLDKLGVKPDFMHIGAYKSAQELFMRDGPSPEADAMLNWLFDSIYDSSVRHIADGRKVDVEKAKKWIDTAIYTADKAKEAGILDAIEHRQEFDALLKKKYGDGLVYERKYGVKKKEQIDFSSPFAMFKILGEMMAGPQKKAPSGPAVGIVYVDGPITTGSERGSIFGAGGGAYSSDLRKALDEAARDDSIKAVVLRIDSPGGSAVASEIILDATRRVKAKKPLVVSMGDVAGSGGYYVALAADTIFADESTITGSIGVLGGKLVTNDMWKKVGITFKSYDRGANANIMASDALWTDAQRKHLQAWMNEVYGTFKKHVTDIRGDRLKKPIDEIAGGRVYTGKQALELGLVDKIGSLDDAVAFAARQAKVETFEVRPVPEPKNFIEKLIEQGSGTEDEQERRWITAGTTPAVSGPDAGSSHVRLAMPYLQNLDPARVAAIRSALEKLEMMDREGVLLVMPEAIPIQ